MSTLNVDNINEYTSGNGVEIPGHVVQVVSTDDHTVASYSLSGTSPQKLGSLEISITPKSTSSKIYLSATINGQCKGRYMAVCFVRGTNTKLGESTNTAGSRSLVFMSPVYGEYTEDSSVHDQVRGAVFLQKFVVFFWVGIIGVNTFISEN